MPVHATLPSLRRYSLILMGLTIILAACGGKGDGGSSTTTCAPATILLTDVTAPFSTKGANKMGGGSNHGGHGGSEHGGHGGSSTTACTPATTLLPDVAALFPINGANWNDYLTGDDWKVATGACIADAAVPCLHGGERRVVELTGKTACAGLTAADDLGAFEWICDDSVSPVRMISTGLAKGKSLSDLIDFTTPGFKTNKVTVYDNTVAWRSTPDSNTWWSNPVEINNTGGSLATASTIYLVTSNPAAAITLGANKVALVAEPSVTLTGPGTAASVILAASRDYLWIEGNINASDDNYGVNLNTRYSTLRQLNVNNAINSGVFLNTTSNNNLTDVTASNNGSGISLSNSSGNRLRGMTASNNIFGVSLSSSSNNTLMDVTASNNSNSGVYLSSSSNNILTGVTASNNITAGIFLYAASNNTLNSMTANNSIAYGVFLQANSNNNTFAGVTTSNNAYGVSLQTGSNNNALTNVTSSINAVNGVVLSTVSDNKFSGLLKVGNNGVTDCQASGGSNPGLDNTTCANNGSSDATLSIGPSITLASSFVDKVIIEDVVNASDTSGTASFPVPSASFDWSQFDNPYRAWGLDGSAFPNADHRGRWTTGAGRIWDWSLLASDTVNRTVLSLPNTGSNTQTHVWLGNPMTTDNTGCNAMISESVWNTTNSVCETTFLSNAVEIAADGIGNDNGLCESAETCIYTPNIGSYQGSGALMSAGAFTDGTLTGITLKQFTQNGE